MTEVAVEVATRLALYLGCLVVALVAGWALGQMAVLVDPQMSVPGTAPFHEHVVGAGYEVAVTEVGAL
jgi:hypothetical protein